MTRIKSILASALVIGSMVAALGFGVLTLGFAIILGGALALAVRLATGSKARGVGTMGEADDSAAFGRAYAPGSEAAAA